MSKKNKGTVDINIDVDINVNDDVGRSTDIVIFIISHCVAVIISVVGCTL